MTDRSSAPLDAQAPDDTAGQSEPTWYAIRTRSRHEQVVCEQLEGKQIEAFLPTITRWSRWKDRKKRVDWPLFPGYCFARFDSSQRLSVLAVVPWLLFRPV